MLHAIALLCPQIPKRVPTIRRKPTYSVLWHRTVNHSLSWIEKLSHSARHTICNYPLVLIYYAKIGFIDGFYIRIHFRIEIMHNSNARHKGKCYIYSIFIHFTIKFFFSVDSNTDNAVFMYLLQVAFLSWKPFSGKFKLNSCLVALLEAVAPRCQSKAADLLFSCWSQSLLQKTWPARSYFPQRERNTHISRLSRLCQKSISYQGAYVLEHKGAALLTMLIMKFLCAKDFLETSWRFFTSSGASCFFNWHERVWWKKSFYITFLVDA